VSEISDRLTQPPTYQLNRHCAECSFQSLCHDITTPKDDLSLLPNMPKREQKKLARRGIFTVTQLSYVFRPRRRPAKQRSTRPPYSHPLKALAIRDRKIYVNGCPAVPTVQTPIVFLDVEGDADQQFYYLAGLLISDGHSTTQHSFWANSQSDETEMWASCVRVLSDVSPCHIMCYGEFDRVFLHRMKTRYPDIQCAPGLIDTLLTNSTNVLSLIYAHIYFPTYSNGLKDIASHLGFAWTCPSASGQYARVWRCQWELSSDPALKDRLIAYNMDDCKALEVVFGAIERICAHRADGDETKNPAPGPDVVRVDELKREYSHGFRTNQFANAELDYINKCAYWDYQRNKVYLRTSVEVKKAVLRKTKERTLAQLPANADIELNQRPGACPKCGTTARLYAHIQPSRTVYDLQFTSTGVRRKVVRYTYRRLYCTTCKGSWSLFNGSKFGSNLRALCLYYVIELRVPMLAVGRSVRELFGLPLPLGAVRGMKTRGAADCKGLYDELFKRVTHGSLLHVDETKVSINGKEGFVWVFANLEEAVYIYRSSREAAFVRDALKEFRGVLISDFYTAYDGIACPQQKCLIHLIRDLNDALLKEPFNTELRTLITHFSTLMKEIIETVDRFGLKSYYLRKHKGSVAKFFKEAAGRDWKTDIVRTWRRRFEKNRKTLFTFLDHDGIPWNNNNAEHAVKKFALLRDVIGGTCTEAGIREYLILLSVCESCNLKGIRFLEFVRSGETSLEGFLARQRSSLAGAARQERGDT
jgi:Transposase IS66 family/RNase_H superfamily